MAIINNAPATIQECELYKLLQEKCKEYSELLEHVDKIIEIANPMLDLVVAGPFRNYTLHNPEHSKKLIHLAGCIISNETKAQLTPLDIAIFIYCAYLHDLGMSVTNKERQRILESSGYEDLLLDSPELADRIRLARQRQEQAHENEKNRYEFELFQLQEIVLSIILREKHATTERYKEIIGNMKRTTGRDDLFSFHGVSFEDILIKICESHNLDAGELAKVIGTYESNFPRDLAIGGLAFNSQYCAALLRLTDILDFDRERTPKILFDNLGIAENDLPGARVSLYEWQKHMAVHTLEVKDSEVVISADSQFPAIEASVREFGDLIEREIKDTLAVLRFNPPGIIEKYRIDLPTSARVQIRSIGYIFYNVKLELNHESIMTLLMGENLYSNPAVPLRELLQNSVEACLVRQQLENRDYSPQITITTRLDEHGRRWIDVEDNGLGMDDYVISEYLFKIGKSYYRSADFLRLIKGKYVPISRFGIGIASTFMIADLLRITTANLFSTRGDHIERTITFDNNRSLAFIVHNENGRHGTTVSMRLKPEWGDATSLRYFEQYVASVVVRPRVPVKVKLISEFTLTKDNYISLNEDAVRKAEQESIRYVVLDLGRYSNYVEGLAILPLAVTENGLSIRKEGRRLRFDELHSINPHDVFNNYPGNRVTVNGFRMGLKKTSGIFGKTLRFAYDINIIGDDDIIYDVARDRISGLGSTMAKKRVREAILEGLSETGILEKMQPETQDYVKSSRILLGDNAKEISDEIVGQVKDLLPKGIWPIGIHKDIAKRLGISNQQATRAITLLLDTGQIEDGRRK